ncbi:hypothetical protein BH11MYX4_BH11MYX4_64140 [soil metagenome]
MGQADLTATSPSGIRTVMHILRWRNAPHRLADPFGFDTGDDARDYRRE